MRSLTGFILGLIGSIFNLGLAVILAIFSVLVYIGKNALVEANVGENLLLIANKFTFWLIFLFFWFLLFGVVGIIYSSFLNQVGKVKKGGVGCFISGIFTVNLFLIIGGIMGFVVGGRYPHESELSAEEQKLKAHKELLTKFEREHLSSGNLMADDPRSDKTLSEMQTTKV